MEHELKRRFILIQVVNHQNQVQRVVLRHLHQMEKRLIKKIWQEWL